MSPSAETEATARIESALRDSAQELDLHGLDLKTVPDLPAKLQSLRSLNLSDNRLTELPEDLWQLVGLKHLDLGKNRLTALDPAIGCLARLEHLDASENRLTSLPPELAKCVRVRRLDLYGNRLTDISLVGALPALVELDVSRNRLAYLPRFESARLLTALDASYNRIASLTPWCDSLGQLRRLDLSGNRLEQVAGLASLPLEHLYLDDNLLVEPPRELATLESLRFLSASGNPFGDLPEEFARVGRLEDRNRARDGIHTHTSHPGGVFLKAEPYHFDFSLQSEGVAGTNELIDLLFKRFDGRCSAELTFPDGSHVQLGALTRKAALGAVEQHRQSLEAGEALLDLGEADSVSDRDTKSKFAEEAIARLPCAALVPKSADQAAVPFVNENYVSRYVRANHPDEVEPNHEFAVTVTLRISIDGLPDGARPLRILATADASGQPTGAPPLVVRLQPSKAFESLSGREAKLTVPTEADPTPVSFRLRAREDALGPQEINLVFFQDHNVFRQLRLIVKVVAEAGDRVLTATFEDARRPWDTAQAAPPDAVLTVNRTRYQGCDSLHYRYEWIAEGWPSVEAGTVELQSSVADWTAERYLELSRLARRPLDPDPKEEQLEDLNRIGENLYRDIVPQDVRAFLAKFLPKAQSLLIYTNDPWIPWEIVKPWGDKLPAEHSDFLCARLALSRWYYSDEGQTPAATITARRLAAIMSPANLHAVDEERRYLENIPSAWPPIRLAFPSPSTPSDIVTLLSAGDVNLVHFATHGLLQSDGVSIAMLPMGGQEFSLDYLVGPELEQGLRRAAPLVVTNACHTARRKSGLTRPDGWAERFLELGSSAFVGANWEVADQLACRFACVLYDVLRQGQALGRAVQLARDAIRQEAPANSTWLAYTLYAHPNAVVRAG